MSCCERLIVKQYNDANEDCEGIAQGHKFPRETSSLEQDRVNKAGNGSVTEGCPICLKSLKLTGDNRAQMKELDTDGYLITTEIWQAFLALGSSKRLCRTSCRLLLEEKKNDKLEYTGKN
jgi:hypothetical protein